MRKRLAALGMTLVLAMGCMTGCGGSTPSSDAGSSADSSAGASSSDASSESVSVTLQKLRKAGSITISGSGTAPFGFIDTDTNEMCGIDLEISIAIAHKLGIDDVKYTVTTFDQLITELQAGKCDVVSSAMYITEERQKVVSFSNIYYKEGEGILYNKDKGYTKLEDMKGAVCAIEQGSGYADVAQKYVDEGIFKRLDTYPSIDETVLALKSSKADVAMADNVALAYINSQDGNKSANLTLLDPYEMQYAGNIGAALPQDDPEFIQEWNTALDELKEDGTVLEIMEKYGLDESFFVSAEDGQTVNPN